MPQRGPRRSRAAVAGGPPAGDRGAARPHLPSSHAIGTPSVGGNCACRRAGRACAKGRTHPSLRSAWRLSRDACRPSAASHDARYGSMSRGRRDARLSCLLAAAAVAPRPARPRSGHARRLQCGPEGEGAMTGPLLSLSTALPVRRHDGKMGWHAAAIPLRPRAIALRLLPTPEQDYDVPGELLRHTPAGIHARLCRETGHCHLRIRRQALPSLAPLCQVVATVTPAWEVLFIVRGGADAR